MIRLDPDIAALLERLERFAAEHDARAIAHREKMLNLERATAELLYLLVAASGRRRVLEIGTSNGYSTIWLACALRNAGAEAGASAYPHASEPLISIERDAAKLVQARANLAQASLEDAVHVLEGDATDHCRALPGPFDCVFFDADRISAPAQLAALLPKLSDDALLLADNALSHPDEIAGYLAAVEATDRFDTTVVPVGKGLHVARRRVR